MLFAQRTNAGVPLTLAISDAAGPVSGATATLRVRDGATEDSYLDFADSTFKASGWTAQDQPLAETQPGQYLYLLDLSALPLTAIDSLVIEYHCASPAVDAVDVIVLQQLTTVALALAVSAELGGVEGLTATVRVRDEAGLYLDFDDDTFKISGWTLRDAPMTEIGRGHYHRTLDTTALVNRTGTELVAEYETAGALSVTAGEALVPVYSIDADATPPLLVNIDPVPNGLLPTQHVTFDVTDETSLLTPVVLARFPIAGLYEVVHDGTIFAPQYRDSTRTAIVGGWHYDLIRRNGWPLGDTLRLRIVAYDQSGNPVMT